MRRDSDPAARRSREEKREQEVITVRALDLPHFRRMTEAARLLREIVDEPETVEIEVEAGSSYGRVSFTTAYLCLSGRDLETFQRVAALATELLICPLEDEFCAVELTFPAIFSSYELRAAADGGDHHKTDHERRA